MSIRSCKGSFENFAPLYQRLCPCVCSMFFLFSCSILILKTLFFLLCCTRYASSPLNKSGNEESPVSCSGPPPDVPPQVDLPQIYSEPKCSPVRSLSVTELQIPCPNGSEPTFKACISHFLGFVLLRDGQRV